MAGRGRGRFKGSMSFTHEQLAKGEAASHPVLELPSKYPILEYKPLSFTITNEMSYLLELKREYTEYLKESPFNVQPIEVKKDVERYSDRFQDFITDKSGYETKYDWSKLPAELKPSIRRKKTVVITVPKKKQKIVDVESKLQELEKKENTQQGDVQEEEEKVEEEEEEKEVVLEEEEIDEEMDEGTDYANSYFDNGEDDDEEDNVDDVAIY